MSIEDGIADDRTVDDPYQGIETFFCPLEDISIAWDDDHPEDAWLRITGDDGGTNVEIRVPIKILEQNGFTWDRVLPSPDDTNCGANP